MNEPFTTNRKYQVMLTIIILIVSILGILYFLYVYRGNPRTTENVVTVATSSPLKIIATDERYKLADQLYNQGKSEEAYKEFTKIIDEELADGNPGTAPIETLKLYKIAALRGFDRELSYREYYEFYKDTDNSLANRAYALLVAQQAVIGDGDIKKLLFVLSEQDKKEAKILDERTISYIISKKIYELYPYPISAARLANYEFDKLDKSNPNSREMAKGIYDKYMFNFDEELQNMISEDGLKHLTANTILNKSLLMSRLEDYGLMSPDRTTESFSDALKYSLLYSPRGTYHFILLDFLNHQIKINNQEGIDKIIKALEEEKLSSEISKLVMAVFSDNLRLKNGYPNLYEKMQSSKEFKLTIQNIFISN